MAFGKKDDKFLELEEDKEYYGVFGQKMIIAVNVSGLYSNCEKDTKKLNLYLKNGWNFKRVDTDVSGTMFYMLEKQ